jgi:hypothetical protein
MLIRFCGHCNFSLIGDIVLRLSIANVSPTPKVKIFAVSYNILRIMSGQGALLFT